MIERFEARNSQGSVLSVTLGDPTSGYLIEDIGGLGPVKATLVSSSFAGVDGESYQSARREARDITLKINLKPNLVGSTVYELRRRLYSFFMPKSSVWFRFYLDNGLYVDIDGRVETNEPDRFTKEPSVNISVRCFKPDFVDPNVVTINGSTTSGPTGSLIEYVGNIETGILFTMNVDRDLGEFAIYHTPANSSLRSLEFVTPLEAGDILMISTISGSKGALLTRGGIDSSVLYGVSPQSKWIELQEGDNDLRIYAVGAAIPYTIQYTTKYGGL